MNTDRLAVALLMGAGLVVFSGCTGGRLAELQSQNRALREQNTAQIAELENLKVHSRNIEDQLLDAEEQLALTDERAQADRRRLAGMEADYDGLYEQLKSGMAGGRLPMPGEVSNRLARISERYPSLNFDPATGISKLDTDILFDTGETSLKAGAERALDELAEILKSPEAADLKIMVVGHTDDRQIARRPARDKFADNFHLSSARALEVAKHLQQSGVQNRRIGIAGFGAHQPIAPNVTSKDRQKNRRVEIFVMAPDVPVVGWTDSMPTVY